MQPSPGTSRRALLARLAALSVVGAVSTGLTMHRPMSRTEWRRAELTKALQRAASQARPLLVLVIPSDESRRWELQDTWGEVITHGSDDAIAALASCELACGTEADITALLPSYRPQDTAPALVRIDPATRQHAAHHVTLPTRPASQTATWEERQQREDRFIDARIAAMEALIAAAVPAAAATRSADIAARRTAPITGSRWMSSAGCGASPETPDPLAPPEGDERLMVSCGMGHVSTRSARFLDFLTHEPGA